LIDLGEQGYWKASTSIRPLEFAHLSKMPSADSLLPRMDYPRSSGPNARACWAGRFLLKIGNESHCLEALRINAGKIEISITLANTISRGISGKS